MDEFQWTELILRFPHLAEAMFEILDDQSLTSCRLVEKSWKNLIDSKNYSWERIVKRSNLEQGNLLKSIDNKTISRKAIKRVCT